MTAPVLTPAEEAEASRFGIHDQDVIADLEQRLRDVESCEVCKAAATVRLSMVCCGNSTVLCQGCYVGMRIRWNVAVSLRHRLACVKCRRVFRHRNEFDDVVTVVSL